eukprot:GSChrysophyteH1.ASY1.ANO1.310.1 assembled CDS
MDAIAGAGSKSGDSLGKNIDEHPLAVDHYLVVRYRDDSPRLAKILGVGGRTKESQKYYVHYFDFNRRMDEWINPDRIMVYPSAANPLGKERAEAEELIHKQKQLLENTLSQQPISDDEDFEPSGGMDLDDDDEDEDADAEQRRAAAYAADSPTDDMSAGTLTSLARKESRHHRAARGNMEMEHDEHEGLDEDMLREHEELTKIKNFNTVMLGKHVMECWYFSPFPREYWVDAPHPEALPRHPPGNELYRDSKVSMFEIDGAVEKVYCQNLCYFAKLFLDHKTLFEDVDVFLFYVLCTYDDQGFHPVGYFSKNKYSDAGFNLACILTFPSAQRKGYGRFLISFSYELSKKENKVGSPEKPLSDLGNLSYRSYWATVILNVLKTYDGSVISIMDICRMTSIVAADVLLTLDMLGLVYTVSDDSGEEATGDSKNIIITSPSVVDDLLLKYPPNSIQVDPDKLHWAPLYITDPKRDKWTIASKLSTYGDQQ